MNKTVAILILSMLVTPMTALAQDPSAAEDQTQHVKAALTRVQVGRDARVSVRLKNDMLVVGLLAGVGNHSFFVTDPETQVSTQVPYRNVKQVNAMSTGAKIAIVAGGIVLGWLLICPNLRCGIGGQ